MSEVMSRALCALSLAFFFQSFLFSGSLFAVPLGAVHGTVQLIPLVRGAQPIESEKQMVTNWELPLSKYQKIDGQWRLSESAFISGQLSYYLYLIQPVSRLAEVMSFYESVFKQKGWQVRFHCERRDCGDSNDWANRFFNNKRLNGLEGRQSLTVAGKGEGVVVLYIVERPTGQLYLAVYELIEKS